MDEYAIVIDIVSEIVEEDPPQLFDLTGLQKESNSRYGLSAKETLDCAQSLYEKGMLSYPRTSSHYITPDMEQGVSALLSGGEEGDFGSGSSSIGGDNGSGNTAPLNMESNTKDKIKGKEIYGPYYDEAVKLHEENPDYFPDPNGSTIVQGDELAEMRSQYNKMVAIGLLERGHHKQGLAFGGKNERSNITHTGESTIRRDKLPSNLQEKYYESGHTKNPNYKQANIFENPKGELLHNGKKYSLGKNPDHTKATNFQNKVIRWQIGEGLR